MVSVQAAADVAADWIASPATEEPIDTFGPAVRLVQRRYAQPRALRVWIATIDLTVPGVELVVSEPVPLEQRVDGQRETLCATTLEFARRQRVQLAINASAFDPLRSAPDEPMNVVGLAAASGRIYSQPDGRFGALYVGRAGRIALKGPPQSGEAVWHVLPGFGMLIDDGRVAVSPSEADSKFGGRHPRTAVGADREGRTLWIVVADGRQPGTSEGLALVELAALFRTLGCWDALNLDGGGSTTLVLQDGDGEHWVLNTPVGRGVPGTLRQCANHLGIRLPPR